MLEGNRLWKLEKDSFVGEDKKVATHLKNTFSFKESGENFDQRKKILEFNFFTVNKTYEITINQ